MHDGKCKRLDLNDAMGRCAILFHRPFSRVAWMDLVSSRDFALSFFFYSLAFVVGEGNKLALVSWSESGSASSAG